MKPKLINFIARYHRALGAHLRGGPGRGVESASALGSQGVLLKLQTLGLARIHERAFKALNLTATHAGAVASAQSFFSAALSPIIETSPDSRRRKREIHRLERALNGRTLQLAASDRLVEKVNARRKVAEAEHKKTGARYAELLRESLRLQQGLRHLTRRLIRAQERERQMFSKRLHAEVGRALVGISVGLLALGNASRKSKNTVIHAVSKAQWMAVESARRFERSSATMEGK